MAAPVSVFFFMAVGLLVDASPTVSPAPEVDEASRLQAPEVDEASRLQAPEVDEASRLQSPEVDEASRLQAPEVDEASRLQAPEVDEASRLQSPEVDEASRLQAPEVDEASRLQAPEVDEASRLQEETPSSDCPSCSLLQMRKNLSSSGGQSDMVEAVKRHILSMLHLSSRPNVTQPVPRAALLNAIKKLNVVRVAEDGSVEIQDEGRGPWGPTPPEQPSEMITFAEPAGASLDTVTFDIWKEGSGPSVVEEATVWIFLKTSMANRVKGKVMLRLLQLHREDDEEKEECVSEKMVDTRRSGWHTLTLSRSVQTLLDGRSMKLRLRLSCPLCAGGGASPVLGSAVRDPSHRPFLMVALRAEEEEAARRRVKRGLECDGKIRVCCKRQFYVNFKDIGWNDWIIAPSGYHANYCEGDCPNHMLSFGGSSLSFHSTVINHYRLRGYSPFQNSRSCCVPTRLRAMSMLYYSEDQKIIKKDIQDMIVDQCGCS